MNSATYCFMQVAVALRWQQYPVKAYLQNVTHIKKRYWICFTVIFFAVLIRSYMVKLYYKLTQRTEQ